MTWRNDLPIGGPSNPASSAELRDHWLAIENSLSGSWVADGPMLLWPSEVVNTDQAVAGSPPGSTAMGHWTLSGTGSTIRRAGPGLTDTLAPLVDGWSAKVAFGSAIAQLSQTLLDSAKFPTYYRGKYFVAAVGCWTANLNQARIWIDDGSATAPTLGDGYSSFHAGNSAWQWLTAIRQIKNDATQVVLRLRTETAGAAYWNGACALPGEIPPQRFVACQSILSAYRFGIPGAVAIGNLKDRHYPGRPGLVKWVQLWAGTAPTGAALIVDVNQFDGAAFTSMFTTKPTIAISAGAGGAVPDGVYARRCVSGYHGAAALVGGETVSYDVDQVGSTIAGSDLGVRIDVMQFVRPQESMLSYNSFR